MASPEIRPFARTNIPAGYVLGRLDGNGDVQLISLTDLALNLVKGGTIPSSAVLRKVETLVLQEARQSAGAQFAFREEFDDSVLPIFGPGSTAPSSANDAVTVTSASGSLALDYNDGSYQRLDLTGNVTSFAVSNWPSALTFAELWLEIRNTGAYAINAWPTGTVWPGTGTAPTITSGSGKADIIKLKGTSGSGGPIYGIVIEQNYDISSYVTGGVYFGPSYWGVSYFGGFG